MRIKCPRCGYEFEVGRHIITIVREGLSVKLVDEEGAEE